MGIKLIKIKVCTKLINSIDTVTTSIATATSSNSIVNVQQIQRNTVTNNENSVIAHNCGDLNILCQYCKALHFIHEKA